MHGAQARIMAWAGSATDNVFVTVTPSIFMVVTRSTPARSGRSSARSDVVVGRQRRSPYVHLSRFSRKLLTAAHCTARCGRAQRTRLDVAGWDDKISVISILDQSIVG